MQHYQTSDPVLYGLLKDFVKQLRNKRPTEAETVMWQLLRQNGAGAHFRRQHIIGPYIADFCCLSANLIVELDGGYHQLPDQQVKDEDRTAWLNQQGYRILRFTNDEVLFDTDRVLHSIINIVNDSITKY